MANKKQVQQVNDAATEIALEERSVEAPVEENLETEKVAEPKKAKAEQAEIEITYFENAKVTCSCGTTFSIGSTKPEIRVEVCSKCHPFYTGQAKFVDTEGRVEAFQRRASAKKETKEKKDQAPAKPERPKSLKEMLEVLQASQ